MFLLSSVVLLLPLSSYESLGVSDAVEYLAVAFSDFRGTGLGLFFEGELHPSRYFPWFSKLFIVPELSLFSGDPLWSVLPLIFLSVLTVLLVFSC